MPKVKWLAFLCSLFIVLPCSAQMMSPSAYREFLKRLDISVAKWHHQVDSLNVEKLNVTFSIGKTIEHQKDAALQHLGLIHQLISRQLIKDFISNDISMEGSL